MKFTKTATAAAIVGLSIFTGGQLAASPEHDMGQEASYEVTFVPSWNPATHPMNYPLSHAKQGLLTPIIGATHDRGFALFAEGKKPTPGLERLSEMGMHSPLDEEIQSAMMSKSAGTLIRFDEASPGPVHPAVSATFSIAASHPLVSLVGMVAPSPDWFYGVSGVSLHQDGQWVPSRSVTVYAWDSGGDAGTTYMAEDQDLVSKDATRRLENELFGKGKSLMPVGTFVFKRIPSASR